MASKLTILTVGETADFARNLAKQTEFLGASAVVEEADRVEAAGAQLQGGVMAAHWRAWQRLEALGTRQAAADLKALLIAGWDDSDEAGQFLRKLTNDLVAMAPRKSGAVRQLSIGAAAEVCFEWSGLSFETKGCAARSAFSVKKEGAVETLVSRDGEAVFVRISSKGCQLFLLAQDVFVDLESPAPGKESPLEWFEGFVPFMMFVRSFFGKACWQAQSVRGCVIIDDPLLRRRYGHLDYQDLLGSMQRRGYSTCIAFIPWNYRRTAAETAALFRARPELFSLCVHGCDHRGGEFALSDSACLKALLESAWARMERHRRLTQIPFSPVMVFPQGLFSKAAMKALGGSQFLAAVNTTAQPTDGGPPWLTFGEVLEPAVTRYSSFPLFSRRYPTRLADCVLDVFVGKPLLLVEHHGYFREGCGKIEKFVGQLNALAPKLNWTNLENICSQTCLVRVDSDGCRHVRFYTDRFVMPAAGESGPCILYRRHGETPEPVVKVNGRLTTAILNDGWLVIRLNRDANAPVEVVLDRRKEQAPASAESSSFLREAGTFMRRRASEFRDNVLDKNAWFGPGARRVLAFCRNAGHGFKP